jgi:hypothetical protein
MKVSAISFVNLFGDIDPLLHPKIIPPLIVNLTNTPTTFTFGNTSIKQKCNNIFSHVIKSTNKTNQELVNAMEKMNVIQL